jgi:hypothetical protein
MRILAWTMIVSGLLVLGIWLWPQRHSWHHVGNLPMGVGAVLAGAGVLMQESPGPTAALWLLWPIGLVLMLAGSLWDLFTPKRIKKSED